MFLSFSLTSLYYIEYILYIQVLVVSGPLLLVPSRLAPGPSARRFSACCLLLVNIFRLLLVDI